MRIPDDVEELVLAFMDQEKKSDLRKMTREQIDALILGEIGCAVGPGYLAKNDEPGAFPFKVTGRGPGNPEDTGAVQEKRSLVVGGSRARMGARCPGAIFKGGLDTRLFSPGHSLLPIHL